MMSDLRFDYYHGDEAEQFSFIRIPKLMLTDKKFSGLSLGAKVLYGLLLDRMNLSRKHNWIDEKERVYIKYRIVDIQETLGLCDKTAMKYLSELEDIGLVEKQRVGLALGNRLYVKNFITDSDSSMFNTGKKFGNGTEDFSHPLTLTFSTNETPKNGSQSNKEINKNNSSNTQSFLSRDVPDDMKMFETYKDVIKENIDYEYLKRTRRYEASEIDEILELMAEVMICNNPKMWIAGNEYSTNFVKGKLMKIESDHIEYVLNCMKNNTTKIRNIKKYLLTALFNAPSTIGNFYAAEARHDLHG